jgi:hypothetical protein
MGVSGLNSGKPSSLVFSELWNCSIRCLVVIGKRPLEESSPISFDNHEHSW